MNERAVDNVLPAEPAPDTEVEAKLSGAPGFAVKGLFVLALFYTFYFARSLLLPIVLALLLSLILYPAVRALKRLRVPEPAGAALIVAALCGALGLGLYQLFEPASEWISTMPRIMGQIERKLVSVRRSVQEVTKAAEKVVSVLQKLAIGDIQQAAAVDPAARVRRTISADGDRVEKQPLRVVEGPFRHLPRPQLRERQLVRCVDGRPDHGLDP